MRIICRRERNLPAISAFTVLLLLSLTANAEAATILTENLSKTTADTEVATGSSWLAASFGTGASNWVLSGVTLLLSGSSTTQAQLALYSNLGIIPNSSLGVLTSPASLSSTLSETTFSGGGLNLSANTTYWLVLTATSGQSNWGWTLDNSGNGVGFQTSWAASDNAGQSWFSFDNYPLQLSVTADSVATAIPEPSTFLLLSVGLSLAISFQRRTK